MDLKEFAARKRKEMQEVSLKSLPEHLHRAIRAVSLGWHAGTQPPFPPSLPPSLPTP